MKIAPLAISLILAVPASAQDGAVPVEDEPHHKTVLKNPYVQAFRVILAPGEASLMHRHAHDDGAVRLSTATVAARLPGQSLGPPESVVPGFVSARDNEARPHVHEVHNIGSTVFEVIDVQALERPPGPSAAALAAPAAENAKMRVYRYELEPGAATASHGHTRPYLLVAATDVQLRMVSPDGKSMEHPVKAGEMHWVDAAVTHSLVNRGAEKAILVEFELK
jgi:quercetin dioxygenase-like cupin family protein